MATNTIKGYRLVSPQWASTALTGEGARKYGGRWNSPGYPVVYLAESRALCALELLVHLTTPETRTKSFMLLEVRIPAGSLDALPASALPPDWNISPPTRDSRAIGDHWLARNRSLALRVPSTIVPEEFNIVLNVSHPTMRAVKIASERGFHFDPRL